MEGILSIILIIVLSVHLLFKAAYYLFGIFKFFSLFYCVLLSNNILTGLNECLQICNIQ